MSAPDELEEYQRQEEVAASEWDEEQPLTVTEASDEELARELAARLVSKAMRNASTPHVCALTVQANVPGSLPMSINLAPGITTSFNWEQMVVMSGQAVLITVPMIARLDA